jgi:predicted MFS family arabinose efflux permease
MVPGPMSGPAELMRAQKYEGEAAGASREEGAPGLPRATLLVFAATCGISVANIYCSQPLLDAIAADFAVSHGVIGLVVSLTQIGYAAGLFFLVPLGDLVDRRRLVIAQTLLSAIALLLVGCAPNRIALLSGMVAVGLLAVVIQVLVAFTADLAAPAARGRAVGFVTSGVVIGILGARFVAGVVADIGGWRAVYLILSVLTITMSASLARALPRDLRSRASETYGAVLRSVPRLFLRDPFLRVRALLAFLIFAAFSTLWTSMVLPLSAPPLALSHSKIGLFGLVGLAGALAAGRAGRLADQGLARWTTGVSLGLLTVSWFLIGLLPHSLVALTAGVLVLDLAVQAIHVTNQSLMFAVRPEARSRLVAGYMLFYSTGSALGAIASTAVYAGFGWGGVSLLGASFSAMAVLVWVANERPGAA